MNQSIVLIDAGNQGASALEKVERIVAPVVRDCDRSDHEAHDHPRLVPMAIGIGEGAELRAPMAITVIGGVTLTTFLTLLVIPVVYSVMDRKTYTATAVAAPASTGG